MASRSATNIYRAYVISETGDNFTFVSERDKKLHTAPKNEGVIPGVVEVEPGHVVGVQQPYFTDPSRLFTACREYCYDKVKNAKAHARKRQEKREEREKQKEERLAKGVMMYGKYKKATYEDILLTDTAYCDWILKQADKNDEIKKFKEWLGVNYKKDDTN